MRDYSTKNLHLSLPCISFLLSSYTFTSPPTNILSSFFIHIFPLLSSSIYLFLFMLGLFTSSPWLLPTPWTPSTTDFFHHGFLPPWISFTSLLLCVLLFFPLSSRPLSPPHLLLLFLFLHRPLPSPLTSLLPSPENSPYHSHQLCMDHHAAPLSP